ncbi:MAG: diguanylate cyclase [Desulfamplus sp.]|nr:diguanylate cyclase [Desulfamplus sp.]
MKTNKLSVEERLKKLKNSFIAQLPVQLSNIKKSFANVHPALYLANQDENSTQENINLITLPQKELQELHRAIHTLKGASASFGLKDLSLQASEAENLVKKLVKSEFGLKDRCDPPSFKSEELYEWYNLIASHISKIEIKINCLDPISKECVDASVSDISESIESGSLENSSHSSKILNPNEKLNLNRDFLERVVYICEDDPFQCANLADQIRCFGFRVSAFNDLDKFKVAVSTSPPDVVVMDMMHNKQPTGGADVIMALMAERKISVPVVFVSAHSDLLSRIAAVRAGSSAYFVKPANPSVLCAALHSLTTSEESEPCRIMIVEDDPYLSAMYATILKDAGMKTTILNDPLKSMPVLAEFRPDLILMDMHMPGCNGMELAKAIRQMEEYISIPILFLSSETDIDIHFNARRMGGDEFLVKPIKPHHLISAVSVRAERMKLIRSFMIKDSMTGLYNHSAIKEYLAIHIEKSIRSQTNMSFAMIDIDKFKTVNDTYGHPVGDQVLVSLASLLKQRLRKSDVIGRYGGEEFAVILPDCSIKEAISILDQLRKNFAAICFTSGDSTFSSSFSCGVATLLDKDRLGDVQYNDRMDRICAAADDALYSAKKGGRNLVVAAPI